MWWIAAVVVLSILLIGAVIHAVEARRLIQKYLDKAEVDRCMMVRIPVNEVLKIGYTGNLGVYSGEVKEVELPDFDRHPATLTPARREKL